MLKTTSGKPKESLSSISPAGRVRSHLQGGVRRATRAAALQCAARPRPRDPGPEPPVSGRGGVCVPQLSVPPRSWGMVPDTAQPSALAVVLTVGPHRALRGDLHGATGYGWILSVSATPSSCQLFFPSPSCARPRVTVSSTPPQCPSPRPSPGWPLEFPSGVPSSNSSPLDHSASNDKRDVEKMQTRARRGRPAAPKGLRCTLNNTQGLAWPTGPAPACLARPPPPALTAWSHWPFQSSDRPSSYPWHFITWPLVSRLSTAGARGLTAWPEDSSPSLCREPALS